MASEALGQLTLARFIDDGALTRHLRRVRPIYRARRDRLSAALATHMPHATPAGAAAGLHLFVLLPHDVCEHEVVAAAHERGIYVEGAARHWADPKQAPPAILIGYGTLHEDAIERNVAVLAAIAVTS
jgi:GntR family transcriptional regulator / MocR family aminotransferase